MKQLIATLNESVRSILPIEILVLLLSVSVSPVSSGVMVLFIFGTVLLLLGMCFFSVGANLSMQPLGEGIGILLSRSKHLRLSLIFCFLLGVAVTVAEPDLQVLANQIPSIPNLVLILAVGAGVGMFLVISMVRLKNGFP